MKRFNDKKYVQLIPEKVLEEFDKIEEQVNAEMPYGYNSDKLRQVISIICAHIRKDNDKIPLKMEYIKKSVPQGDKYLLSLINIGVVERSGYYIPGEVSYKYRFSDGYQSKYVYAILKNRKLEDRIKQIQQKFIDESNKALEEYSELTRYVKSLTIEPEAFNYIEQKITEEHAYNCATASATRIVNKDFFHIVDSTSGRFHSNLTNMKGELLKYLRINGEPLANVDIKNSQPYCSIVLLTNPNSVAHLTQDPDLANILQNIKVPMAEDVCQYISLVVSGLLYEYLMGECEKEGFYITRNEAKSQIFRILFSKNKMPRNPVNDTEVYIKSLTDEQREQREDFIKNYPVIRKVREVFINHFPTVHRVFNQIKGHEKGDRFNNYKRFSILLQRIESHILLKIVVKRIAKESPSTVILTKHDSIITTRPNEKVITGAWTNNVEVVVRIMTEEFEKFIGFKPTIKVEA